MVEHGKKIKIIGIAVAVILVIALAVSLVYAFAPDWLRSGSGKEQNVGGQAELLVFENERIISEPVPDLESFLVKADKPVFIDFWAEWCGPCKLAAPFVESLAEEYDGQAYILKVDVDLQTEIASRYRIQSIPTFIVVADNEIKSQQMGYADQLQPVLRDMIENELP